jgi:ribosome-binding protein aMBF1 (putative translation factor)
MSKKVQEPASNVEALGLGLALAVTAPTEAKSREVLGLAEQLASRMSEIEVACAQQVAEKLIHEMPSSSNTFGARVKEARRREGLTQLQLCTRLKVHGVHLDTSAITRIENARRDPRLREALAIAKVLRLGAQ